MSQARRRGGGADEGEKERDRETERETERTQNSRIEI